MISGNKSIRLRQKTTKCAIIVHLCTCNKLNAVTNKQAHVQFESTATCSSKVQLLTYLYTCSLLFFPDTENVLLIKLGEWDSRGLFISGCRVGQGWDLHEHDDNKVETRIMMFHHRFYSGLNSEVVFSVTI